MHTVRLLVLLIVNLLTQCECCLLCPLRIPPRPRPLDQFKLLYLDQMVTTSDNAPILCNDSQSWPVSDQCRHGVSKVFCAITDFVDAKSMMCDPTEGVEKCVECSVRNAQIIRDNLWIVKWLDSIGKMPEAVSEGNYHWLGDYGECLELRETGAFNGQYCRFIFEIPDSGVDEGCPQTDPLEVHLGMCAPSECSTNELRTLVQSVSPYEVFTRCEMHSEWPLSSLLFVSISLIWLLFLMIGTIFEVLKKENVRPTKFQKWSECVSVRINGKRALSTKRNHSLHAINGLQVITVCILVTANCYNFMMPYMENVIFSFENVHSWPFHPLNNFSLHVDALLALSALVTTLLLRTKLQETWTIRRTYFKRCFQVWPSYAYIVLFMLLVFERLNSGPMWNLGEMMDRCHHSWWKNIFFISNLFSARNTCVDGGYLMDLEAQFYIVLLPMIFFIQNHAIATVICSLLAITLSTIYTFITVYIYSLPPSLLIAARTIPVSEFETYIDSLYLKPWARAPSFLIGFLFALLFAESKKLNKAISVTLAASLIGTGLFILFALFPYVSYSVNAPVFLAFYSAVHRPLWCIVICMVVYLCHRQSAGDFASFLEWRIFSPLSKLIYTVFIISEPVSVYLFASLHRPLHATHWSSLYNALGTIVLSYIIAFGLDIFIARPCRNLIMKLWRSEDELEPVQLLSQKAEALDEDTPCLQSDDLSVLKKTTE